MAGNWLGEFVAGLYTIHPAPMGLLQTSLIPVIPPYTRERITSTPLSFPGVQFYPADKYGRYMAHDHPFQLI